MNSSDIIAGRSYMGCNGITYAVESISDGLVYFRTNGAGTLVSIDLDSFAALMKHEIANKENTR